MRIKGFSLELACAVAQSLAAQGGAQNATLPAEGGEDMAANATLPEG